jgi:hypothetical protein
MKLAGWILRSVDPERGGAASKNLLRAVAKRHGATDGECDRVVRELIESKQLVMIGDRKGAMYGLPPTRGSALTGGGKWNVRRRLHRIHGPRSSEEPRAVAGVEVRVEAGREEARQDAVLRRRRPPRRQAGHRRDRAG